jgi:hypothetical protein
MMDFQLDLEQQGYLVVLKRSFRIESADITSSLTASTVNL